MPEPNDGHPEPRAAQLPVSSALVPVPHDPVVAASHVPDKDGNPTNMMIFHSKTKMTDNLNEQALANSNCDEDVDGEIYCPISRMVINIPGVAELRLEPYALTVRKATLFKWKDIAPKIMEILLTWHNTQVGINENRVVLPGEDVAEGRRIFLLPPGTGMQELYGGDSWNNQTQQ